MYAKRIEKLQSSLAAAGLDGLVLNPGPTLAYLTGLHFHLMERPVVAIFSREEAPVLVLPELELGKTTALPYALKTCAYGENPAQWGDVFRQAGTLTSLQGRRIGVEPTGLRFLELRLVEEALPGSRFLSAQAVLASLRMIKDSSELALMRSAAVMAQDALKAVIPLIKVGMTERELAAELTLQLLRTGSDGELPFAPIIASGPNSANPHAVPSSRSLVEGDLLVIDWGAADQAYFSDLTRTVAIGEVDPELERIAEVTIQANSAGRAAIRPGIPAGDVDRAARAVIEAAGYGPYFFHRTGHGLGLQEHEEPYIFGDNDQVLEPGMTFTIEPGIYLPGRGGVRIEDDVVVTSSGGESLSDIPRDLIRVGL
jgi:Xaa-Pro dipeptidase